MTPAVLVARDPALAARLQGLLDDTLDLVPCHRLGEGIERAITLLIDLVLLDLAGLDPGGEELSSLRARLPRAFVVGLVGAAETLHETPAGCDLVVPLALPDAALRATVQQAVRLHRLQEEVAHLRRDRARAETPAVVSAAPTPGSLATVLKEMGKLLATHFDLERLVEFFLDAITELVRPGRSALLLADADGRFRVRGQRGVGPDVTTHIRPRPGSGLPGWFSRSARLAVRTELEREPAWLDAARELQLLGADVAIPLWAQADLVGILTLGPRVTGQSYSAEDLERLFTLASQVATAVQDISRFHTVQDQASFIEQVLAQLQSGAITIAASGRITLVNQRAEEILGIPRAELLGHDLRELPSPLGDLLHQTLQGGPELRLQEVTVPRPPACALEVSTSRILGASGSTVGAVMTLEDPRPRQRLARERQTTQSLDLLNRVLLRLTDEIKNPLVSIYTFLELLPHRYEDTEFREKFFEVVSRDTQNLISLVDKLIILAGEREYKVDFCDLRELVHQALEDVTVRWEHSRAAQDAAIFVLQASDRPDRVTAIVYTPDPDLIVKADRDQLGKAIGYLIRFLLNRLGGEGRLAIHALRDPDNPRAARLSLVGKPASLGAAERERLFSPLAIASERLLDVGPSVSQKIVEAQGGTLAVGGDEGEIRFVLTLPRTTP